VDAFLIKMNLHLFSATVDISKLSLFSWESMGSQWIYIALKNNLLYTGIGFQYHRNPWFTNWFNSEEDTSRKQ